MNLFQKFVLLWTIFASPSFAQDSIGTGTKGLDPSVLLPSPTCIVDPCLCGWCPDEGGLPTSPFLPETKDEALGLRNRSNAVNSDAPSLGRFEMGPISLFQKSVPTELTLCPPQGIRPWGLVRESFLNRDSAISCTAAVEKLTDFENEIGLRISAADTIGIADEISERAISVYSEYANACLVPLRSAVMFKGAVERSNVLGIATAPGQTDLLLASVGRIAPTVGSLTCSAAIVSTDRGPAVLTAAHCLGVRDRNTAEEEGKLLSVFEDVVFTSFDGRSFSLSIDPALDGFSYSRDNSDIVGAFIEPDNSIEGIGLPLVGAPLVSWEPMLIVGENPYLSALAHLEGMNGLDLIQKSMSVTLAPDCVFRAANQGGLVYLCQTAAGMSGSPIIVVRDGKFFVSGVHTRRLAAPSPVVCQNGVPAGGVNGGIAIMDRLFSDDQ